MIYSPIGKMNFVEKIGHSSRVPLGRGWRHIPSNKKRSIPVFFETWPSRLFCVATNSTWRRPGECDKTHAEEYNAAAAAAAVEKSRKNERKKRKTRKRTLLKKVRPTLGCHEPIDEDITSTSFAAERPLHQSKRPSC